MRCPSVAFLVLFCAACAASNPDTQVEALCGAGTVLRDGICTGSSGATCGAGTVLNGTECIPAGASISCGSGTTLVNGACVVSAPGTSSSVTCGSGTVLENNQCLATSVTCGSGTVLSGKECVANTALKRGFRDACTRNADCGCYSNKADDPGCTGTSTKQLICKEGICTIDCTLDSTCTTVFPQGTGCNVTYGANYCR